MRNPNQIQRAKGPQSHKPSRALWLGLILALVAGAGYLYWQESAFDLTPILTRLMSPSEETGQPQPSEAALEPAPEPEIEGETTTELEAASSAEPEAGSKSPAPKGSLVIQANVNGASVYLDGKRLGEAPQSVKGLKPGKYQVKVEKAGYQPFEQEVKLAAERRVLRAELTSLAATLRVTSNVEGAVVRLDGESVGSTPLDLKDIKPGTHELVVSAEGYDTHTQTFELAGGPKEVMADLRKLSVELQESVGVKHKHRIPTRSCEGVLRATRDGIEYDTEHQDRFTAAFSEIEDLEFKGESLNIKIRGGRNYSFNERNENPDALAAFHDKVKATMDKMKQASR